MPSEKLSSHTIRSGTVNVKEDRFLSWLWRSKWLVLERETLSIHKNETSPPQSVIYLRDICAIERIDFKPYCLLLQTKNRRYRLVLSSDDELYSWQDDIYSRSPLGAGNPTDFRHNVHAFIDTRSGGFVGIPDKWSEVLTRNDYDKDPKAVLESLDVSTLYSNFNTANSR